MSRLELPPLVRHPDPRLREVLPPYDMTEKLLPTRLRHAEMILKGLIGYNGAGIAAPQIRLQHRLIAMIKGRCDAVVMFNPEIIGRSPRMEISREGCLSIPFTYIDVMRHVWVDVQWLSPTGEQRRSVLSGFDAAIVQHEIDHLDGILIIDKERSDEAIK